MSGKQLKCVAKPPSPARKSISAQLQIQLSGPVKSEDELEDSAQFG